MEVHTLQLTHFRLFTEFLKTKYASIHWGNTGMRLLSCVPFI